MKILLASIIALTPVSVLAERPDEQQAGYSRTKTCYRTEYREEYVPGIENDPNFVHSWKETIEFPCSK